MIKPIKEITDRFERFLNANIMGDSSQREIRDIVFLAFHYGGQNATLTLTDNAFVGHNYWWNRFEGIRVMLRPFKKPKRKNEKAETTEQILQKIIDPYLLGRNAVG